MTTYATLDEALTDIAGRSFYENARVRKTDDGYAVDDWRTDVNEMLPWSYANGLDVSSVPNVLGYSRTHEACERYETAGHVRFNLPEAVEAIETGEAVGFTYVVAEADCEDPEPEDCVEDHAAGWALIATHE